MIIVGVLGRNTIYIYVIGGDHIIVTIKFENYVAFPNNIVLSI